MTITPSRINHSYAFGSYVSPLNVEGEQRLLTAAVLSRAIEQEIINPKEATRRPEYTGDAETE